MKATKTILKIAGKLKDINGECWFVGGCVRDQYLGLESKDIDIEVHFVPETILLSTLQSFGKVDLVGKSFGVLKMTLDGLDIDFSVPRRDVKRASGHTGFEIDVDISMGIKTALKRRDFTVNAIAENILTGQIADPFGGLDDIKAKVLKVVDKVTFTEDPLRVLRAVQFAGRFEFTIDPESFKFMKSLVF